VTTTKATVTTTVPGCECLKIWMVPVVHQDFWHIYVWPERDAKIAGGTRTYTRSEHDFTEEEAVQSVIEEYLGARGPQPDITSCIGDWSSQLDERTEAP